MQTQSQLTPPTDPKSPEQEWREVVERIAKLLDPDFPSVVISPGPVGAIGEPAGAYLERERPDFVKADDKGWT